MVLIVCLMFLCVLFCYSLTSCVLLLIICFFFKQKTAYEMRISDWSSRRVLFRSQSLIGLQEQNGRSLFHPGRCEDRKRCGDQVRLSQARQGTAPDRKSVV